jgi:hypothetical protein
MKICVRMINCMLVTMSCWYGYLLTSGMCSLANRQAGPVCGRPPCCCDMRLVRMRIRRYAAGQPPLGHSSQLALTRAGVHQALALDACAARMRDREEPLGTRGGHSEGGGRHKERPPHTKPHQGGERHHRALREATMSKEGDTRSPGHPKRRHAEEGRGTPRHKGRPP